MTDTGCVLIFGGTFDPPHRAHAVLPPLVAERVGCTTILYVPTSANPLKAPPPTPAEHRLAMLRLAVADVPDAVISTVELESPGPAYTVDTLEKLRATWEPHRPFRLLLGADTVATFHRWREPTRVLELATPAVMVRPPWDRRRLRDALAEHWPAEMVERWLSWTVDVPAMEVSSTRARELAGAQEEDLEGWLHPDVRRYIRTHGLYRSGLPAR